MASCVGVKLQWYQKLGACPGSEPVTSGIFYVLILSVSVNKYWPVNRNVSYFLCSFDNLFNRYERFLLEKLQSTTINQYKNTYVLPLKGSNFSFSAGLLSVFVLSVTSAISSLGFGTSSVALRRAINGERLSVGGVCCPL